MTEEEMNARLKNSHEVSKSLHLMDMRNIRELNEENFKLRLQIRNLERLLHGGMNFVILSVCFLILWFATG